MSLPRHRSDHHLSDFTHRCCKTLEDLGNSAANAALYDEAVSQYTVALSLDPPSPRDLLIKRSKANVAIRKWNDALNDADQVVYFPLVQVRPC